MLMRINYDNFMIHMIDYFTADELSSLQYLVLSSEIPVNLKCKGSVCKINSLYPSSDTVADYAKYNDDVNILYREYTEELHKQINQVYVSIIDPIIKFSHNIIIVCTKREDIYVDILVEFIRKKFSISCVDLNRLFIEGETDIFYIDRKSVLKSSREIKDTVLREYYQALVSSSDGRLRMINEYMTKSQKIKKLKELGIDVKKSDYDKLDELLKEVWVNGE